MYKTLVEQYEEAFGIEGKEKRARKRFYRRINRYKSYTKIFGEKRARQLILKEVKGEGS